MNVIIETKTVTVKIETHGDPIHWPNVDDTVELLTTALRAHYPHVKSLEVVV